MAFQSVPETAEAVIIADVAGKSMVNVLGFKFATGYTQNDIDALALAVSTRVGSGYRPFLTAGCTYLGTLVRGLELPNDYSKLDVTGAGLGAVGGAQNPNNVTLCITLRTGFTGRSARGRFYALPTGVSEFSAANVFSSAYGNGLVTLLTNIKADAGAIGWSLCVISRFAAHATRPVGITFPVATIQYRNLIADSQRGRLPVGH